MLYMQLKLISEKWMNERYWIYLIRIKLNLVSEINNEQDRCADCFYSKKGAGKRRKEHNEARLLYVRLHPNEKSNVRECNSFILKLVSDAINKLYELVIYFTSLT